MVRVCNSFNSLCFAWLCISTCVILIECVCHIFLRISLMCAMCPLDIQGKECMSGQRCCFVTVVAHMTMVEHSSFQQGITIRKKEQQQNLAIMYITV